MRLGLTTSVVALALGAMASQAGAEDRSRLVACQALIDRAAPTGANNAETAGHDPAELARCRQIVREWMLRDARMSVDERGRPLR